MPSKHTSSDELTDYGRARLNKLAADIRENWQAHNITGNYKFGEVREQRLLDDYFKRLEAYIKTNYILKADVVEAIGQYEFGNIGYDGEEMVDDTSDDMHIRNRFRTQISESLNLEGQNNEN